jgi:predicted ATPase/transcriptional regulator with XRE-family HTH domain
MADSFGELLRRFRVAASLTQEALAERCHISPATIAAIEQGRRKAPRLSTVRLISGALELSAAGREVLAKAADDGGAVAKPDSGDWGNRGAPDGAGLVAGLPTERTSFIGRDREQAIVLAALADSRVVSLVGPGGVGKTRLAARAAQAAVARHPLGAVFVDLVPVREGFVSQAVAALLGVTEGPGRSLDAALHEYLAQGRWLLVLDNCEHLLAVVAAFIEKLLADCGDLTVLATSRERLAIPGERTVTVPPLSLVADRTGGTAGSEAEALFIDRARASDPDFTAASVVGELCARLDGVPLAIELAAARSGSLGVDGLLAGLDDHLRLLAGSRGAHERHRSLRAVIDWSHDLLDGDERAMLRRAGVFVGGFDLDAAVAVSADSNRGVVADLVGRLTDKSLLAHRRGPEGSRWQMLETIRAYALDRLAESDEENAVRDAHLRWAASVADDLERRAETARQWRTAFDTVADDLRAALAWAPGPGAQGVSHRLARALGHLAYARRFMVESREHYRAAAARAPSPIWAAWDLRTAADVAMAEGHGAVAFELLLASAERAGTAGDESARAASLAYAVTIADRFAAEFPEEISHDRLRQLLYEAVRICPADDQVAAACLAAAAAWIAQPEKTVPDPALSRDALAAARLTGDPVLISGALDAVVGVLDAGGRLREAHQVNKERARLLERLPRHDPRAGAEIVDTFHMVTEIAVTAGDLPAALTTARMAADDDIAGGRPHLTASKPVLPLVLQGRFDEALIQAAIMWEAWKQAGRPAARWMGPAIYGIVLAHGLRGDDDGRRLWLARVGELIGTGSDLVSRTNLAAVAAFTDARIALHEGRIGAAAAAIADPPGEAQPWYETPHWYSLRPYAWAIAAEVAVVARLPDAASCLAAAAPAGAENYWAAACLARAAGQLHGDRDMLERSIIGWERIDARFERACTLMLLHDRSHEGLAELRALGCQRPAMSGGGGANSPTHHPRNSPAPPPPPTQALPLVSLWPGPRGSRWCCRRSPRRSRPGHRRCRRR